MDQLNKIKEWLLSLDPDTIIGLLDVSSEEVIARFEDTIIRRKRFLENEMQDIYQELDFERD